jgi:multiple sugar transport system substrate-binding protein
MPVQSEYYTDEKKLDMWASEDLPARPKGFQDAVVKSTYENAVIATEMDVKNFTEINTQVKSALEQVWSGKKTAEQAMTEVKAKTDPLIDGTYSGERS